MKKGEANGKGLYRETK